MKKLLKSLVPLLVVFAILGAFLLSLAWLFLFNRVEPEPVETAQASVRDIVLKTVATGAIVPRNEVELKPRVSGVVKRLVVEPGQAVQAGQLIGEVVVLPSAANLNRARAAVESARIARDGSERELARAESLLAENAVPRAEVEQLRTTRDELRNRYSEAVANLQIVRDGALRGLGEAATEVRSTVAGMVLSVDVEEGESVIEASELNPGTTIAHIADMDDLVFEGFLDESEVGKVREGLPLSIRIGALQKQRFGGTLEYISPMGVEVDGAVQFEIRASVERDEDVFLRAGLSANADIVLDRRDQVLALPEAMLVFVEGAPSVFVQEGDDSYSRRSIEVGLSDGIFCEILSGISSEDTLRRPTASDRAAPNATP